MNLDMLNHDPIVENVTQEQAVRILAELSAHFGVVTPAFRFNRTSRGLYYSGLKTVTIGKPSKYRSWRTAECSLLHEFAHHLADERALARRAQAKADGRANWFTIELPHHGDEFRIALFNVCTQYYGDPKRYPWHTEYKAIVSWARRRGLSAPREKTLLETLKGRLFMSPDEKQPMLDLGMATVVAERRVKVNHSPINKATVIEMFKSHHRMTDIVNAVHGTYALGHTGNMVREILREAGLIPARRAR